MANYEEFMDPNSAIARIIQQMQGAANRSNPDVVDQSKLQANLRPGAAQSQDEEDPNDLIARLLAGQVNR